MKGDAIANGPETDYRDALLVNMYAVERSVLGAKGYILNYPGLELFASGKGVDRGGNYNERFEKQYRISGIDFISVSENGTVTELGEVSGSSQLAMPYSFNTQAIVGDGKMFLYSLGSGFSEVTDSDLGNPIDAIWVDGYYFLTDGEYIYHTDIDDETSIDPLKYATAEFMPDPSLGLLKTQDNKVLVFGRYSLEYFVDAATDDFAFQRVETRAQKIGIVATHAKCEAENIYIVGGRKKEGVAVHLIGIGSSDKVSTREVDKILGGYTEPELADIRMEVRTENNTTFVLTHLPNETLCFNETIAKVFGVESAWSILKSDVAGNEKYRAINGVFDARSSKWVYGDKISANIGVLNNDICTQYGEKVEWIVTTPFFFLDGMSIDEVELETIPGHTDTEDAKVALSITYDGFSFGREYWLKYGDPRDYNQKLIARSLGDADDWMALRFRGASKSRMSFALLRMIYG